MNERDALVRAIQANPDDDSPRLVFADWLDDHDDSERAAFIRNQVDGSIPRIIMRSNYRSRPNWDYLGLPKEFKNSAFRSMLKSSTVARCGMHISLVFTRGFISEIAGSMLPLILNGPAISADHPVERVTINYMLENAHQIGSGRWAFHAIGLGLPQIVMDAAAGMYVSQAEAYLSLCASVLQHIRSESTTGV